MVEPAAFDVGRRLFTPVGRVNIFWKLHLVESQRVFIPFWVETLFFFKKNTTFWTTPKKHSVVPKRWPSLVWNFNQTSTEIPLSDMGLPLWVGFFRFPGFVFGCET